MSKHLSVWWDGNLVGSLTLNQMGEPEFAYADRSDDTSPAVNHAALGQYDWVLHSTVKTLSY